jgi:hypothetical protein
MRESHPGLYAGNGEARAASSLIFKPKHLHLGVTLLAKNMPYLVNHEIFIVTTFWALDLSLTNLDGE